jgi:hypothetical protein
MNDPNTLRKVRTIGPGEHVYEGYDTALICENGHQITCYAETSLGGKVDHCSKCGAKTVSACGNCGQKIRGHLHGTMPSVYEEPIANFCYNCGTPYPWMQDRLQTARELLYHDDKLTLDDREKLWGLLQYVMSNPKSDLVPAKKKLFQIGISKALPATRELLLDFMAKLGAEMLKP